MSRMGEFLISVCDERDEILTLIEERLGLFPELFYGYGANIAPSDEFNSCYPHAQGYALLLIELNNALEIAHANTGRRHKDLACAMAYSHAVTLLEAFVAESLTKLAPRHKSFIVGLAKYYDASVQKMTLSQVWSLSDGVEGKIIDLMRNDVFHNPEKIKKMFSLVFEENKDELIITDVLPIIERRHDIVHRNSISLSGESIRIELWMLERDVKIIRQFAEELKHRMTRGVNSVL